MLYRGVICSCLFLILLVPSFSYPQETEFREYKVVEGDTLWDIAGKELNDKFLWPKVWKENPGISDPDKIYPGQSIRIPLYLLQKEEATQAPQADKAVTQMPVDEPQPAQKAESPQSKPEVRITPPLVPKNIYASSGFLGTMESFAGTIEGTYSGRVVYGKNDTVVVKLAGNPKPGDLFYIYFSLREVTHPITGVKMGSIIVPLGVLKVVKLEHGQVLGEIVEAVDIIQPGYLLNPYVDMTPPVVEQPFRRPDVKGYIVASRRVKIWSVTNDIVYIDQGSSNGLRPGDLIGTMSPEGLYGRQYNVPNGLLQVISTQETTSTAMVVKVNENTADRFIIPGNVLIKAE